VAVRAATVVVDCGAWACLLPRRGRPSFALMLPLRWIAESINTTLPAAQIGGEVVRARLLQRRLDSPARGAASVAVDFSLSLLAQILFTLLGFVLLARLSAAAWWPAAIAALSVPLFAVFSWEMLVRQRLLAALEAWSAGSLAGRARQRDRAIGRDRPRPRPGQARPRICGRPARPRRLGRRRASARPSPRRLRPSGRFRHRPRPRARNRCEGDETGPS